MQNIVCDQYPEPILCFRHLYPVSRNATEYFLYSKRENNQGYKLKYVDNNGQYCWKLIVSVISETMQELVPNEGITRRMSVTTPTTTCKILFDPAEGVSRYHAKIRGILLEGPASEKVIVDALKRFCIFEIGQILLEMIVYNDFL